MKVIKRGELPQDKIHRETCNQCKSELEFKHSEVLWDLYPHGNGQWYVLCPVCKSHVWGGR
jgi:uncharacterized protein with PIN domain